MSLYMLLLSCMPCNDASDCSAEDKVTVTTADTHEDHDDDMEHCTPFCVCACCAAPAVQFHQAVLITNLVAGTSTNTYPADFIFSNNVHTIWQPPRLS